jgi:hypothetical protein
MSAGYHHSDTCKAKQECVLKALQDFREFFDEVRVFHLSLGVSARKPLGGVMRRTSLEVAPQLMFISNMWQSKAWLT